MNFLAIYPIVQQLKNQHCFLHLYDCIFILYF